MHMNIESRFMPRAQGKTESEKEMNESYRIDRTLLYEEVVSALYAMIRHNIPIVRK